MVFRDIDKQAIIENRYRVLSRVSVINTDLVFTEDDSLQEWKLEDFRYVPENGFIGQFVERLFDCKLVDVPEDLNLNDKEVKVEIGIINGLDNDTVTWYSYGNFLVTKVGEKDTSGVVSFESSDYVKKFNQEYVDTITYPCTALQLALNVCEQVGITLGNNNFINSDFVIENNRFQEGASCREVIKAIAQLAYSWARIGTNNKLYIDFTVKDESDVDTFNHITTDDYYETEKDQEYFGPVNRVLIGMSQVTGENYYVDDGEVSEEDVCQIAIYDNPLTYTQALREIAIHGAERLFGLRYIPLTVQSTGHPWLEGDDFISVKTLNNQVSYTYPFNRTLTYKGFIKSEISSQAKNDVSSRYDYNGGVDARIRRTEVIVDKHEGTISALNQIVEEVEKQVRVYNEIKGNPIIIHDAGQYEIISYTKHGKSVQDGTPTPDNSSEIKVVEGIRNELLITPETFISGNGVYVDGANTNEYTIESNQVDLYVNKVLTTGKHYSEQCGNLIPAKLNDIIYYDSGNNLFIHNYINMWDDNKNSLGYTSVLNKRSGSWRVPNENCKYISFRTGYTNSTIGEKYILAPIVSKKPFDNYVPYGNWLKTKTRGKNLIKSYLGTRTYNGITFTENEDGSILVDGTSTATTTYPISKIIPNDKPYFLNGCPTGGGSGTKCLLVSYYDSNNQYKTEGYETGSGYSINKNYDNIQISILVRNGQTIDNLLFEPMLQQKIEGQEVDLQFEPYEENVQIIDLNKKNLFDNKMELGSISTVDGSNSDSDNIIRSKNYIHVLGNRNMVTILEEGTYITIYEYDKDKSYLDNKVIHNKIPYTVSDDTEYIRFRSSSGITDVKLRYYFYEGTDTDDHYELCKIDNVEDTIEDTTLTKRIGKIESYNAETITTDYISTTGSLTTGATVYYVLDKPYVVEIDNYDKLELFKDYNYISDNDNLVSEIEIEYYTDVDMNAVYVTKEELNISNNNIKLEVNNSFDGVNSTISNINGDISSLRDSIAGLNITSENLQIYIQNVERITNNIASDYTTQEELEDHVPKEVTTTTGYTFGANGLIFEKTDSPTSIVVNEQAVNVKDNSDNTILYAGYDRELRNSVVKTVNLVINENSRFQEFTDLENNQAVGCFWLE